MTKMKKVLTTALVALAATVTFATPAAAAPCGGLGRPACTPLPCATAIVPNIVGMTMGDANTALYNAGFTNVLMAYYTGTLGTSGHVVSSNPVAGTVYSKCDQVIYLVKR